MNKTLLITSLLFFISSIYAADSGNNQAEKIANGLKIRPVAAYCLFKQQAVTVRGFISVNDNIVYIDNQWPQSNYTFLVPDFDEAALLNNYLRNIVKKHAGSYEQTPITISEYDNAYHCIMEYRPIAGHPAHFSLDIHLEGQGKNARDADNESDYDDDDLISFKHEDCPCCPVS